MFTNWKRLMGEKEWFLDYYKFEDADNVFAKCQGLAYLNHPPIPGTTSHIQREVGIFSNVASGYQISKQSSWKAPSQPLPPILQDVMNVTNEHFQETFNTVLLNQYKDERDAIGAHFDNPKGNGLNCVVTISLGETRDYVITCATTNKIVRVVPMKHGDTLVMSNLFQILFLHSIPPSDKPCGLRISLTMRRLYGTSASQPTTTSLNSPETKQLTAEQVDEMNTYHAKRRKKSKAVPSLSSCVKCSSYGLHVVKNICKDCYNMNLFTCKKCNEPCGAPDWMCNSCYVLQRQEWKLQVEQQKASDAKLRHAHQNDDS